MTFLAIIICLLLQRCLGSISTLRDLKFFTFYYRHWGSLFFTFSWLKKIQNSWLKVLVLWSPLMLLLFFCGHIASICLGGFGYFCWSLFCLWLCVDAYDPGWKNSHGSGSASLCIAYYSDSNNKNLSRAKFIFQKSFRRVFVLWFCFIVAGPVAVVMYRSVTLVLRDSNRKNTAVLEYNKQLAAFLQPRGFDLLNDLRKVVEWIPVRLLGLSYALVGRFGPTFNCWRHNFFHSDANETSLVATLGVVALDESGSSSDCNIVRQAQVIIKRSIFLWLVIFSLLTIFKF